jgi:hypothetical protein
VVTTYVENVSALALTDAGGVAVAMRRGFARIVDDRLYDVQEFLPPGSRMNDANQRPVRLLRRRIVVFGVRLRSRFAECRSPILPWKSHGCLARSAG